MSIDDSKDKKSYVTPASLANKRGGRYYNPDIKTNQISIEESIKLQEYQEKLQQVFFFLKFFFNLHF
jgi:hypothetical protein